MDEVRVNFAGVEITARPKFRLANGTWLMTALQKHPRFAAGQDIIIADSEVIGQAITMQKLAHLPTRPVHPQTGEPMPVEVDSLTNLVKIAADVKTLASNVAKKFQDSVTDLKDSLSHADKVSDEFTKSAASLRGALGIHGNNGPPLDE